MAGLQVLLGVLCTAMIDETPESRARQALARLVERYEHVGVAHAEWSREKTGVSGARSTEHVHASVARDGRFAYESWTARAAANAPHAPDAPPPKTDPYYVYFDGLTISNAYAEGRRYTTSTAKASLEGWFPHQYMLAPWPLLGAWRDAAQASAGASWTAREHAETSTEDDQFHVRIPLADARALELGWSDADGLTSVAWTSSGEIRLTRFLTFEGNAGARLPTRAERTVSVIDAGSGAPSPRVSWSLRATLDPPDAEATLAFDAVARNVTYFDEATGDVYSPDRSRKLWNVNDVDRTEGVARDHASWWRRGGLGLLAGAMAYSLWRLIRRRGGS